MHHVSSKKRAVGFIYVSTRNNIIGGKLCIRVLPVSPFSPCDTPGISRYTRIPKRNLVSHSIPGMIQRPNKSTSAFSSSCQHAARGRTTSYARVFYRHLHRSSSCNTVVKSNLAAYEAARVSSCQGCRNRQFYSST